MYITDNSAKELTALALSLAVFAQACGGNDNSGGQTATGGTLPAAGAMSTGGAGNSGGVTSSNPSSSQAGTATNGGRGNTGGQSPGGTQSTGASAASGGSTTAGGTTSSGPVTAIDILYMIDNSSSMADKQQVLAASVPHLLAQLAQPNCVDSSGQILGVSQLTSSGPTCASGQLEFKAINNIHIGIVTSSLGDHGQGSTCTPGAPTQYTDANGNPIVQPPDMNDEGHLVGTLTRAQTPPTDILTDLQSQYATLPTDSSSNPYGFLAWGNSNLPTDVSQQDLTDANQIFTDMVTATGQAGCGFESQLEGWFRFLNPVPPILPLAAPPAGCRAGPAGLLHKPDGILTPLAQDQGFGTSVPPPRFLPHRQL